MKKTKVLSFLLCLSLLASLAIPGTFALPTKAAGEQENNGMEISKTATANPDGTYTIKLEAYATGDKVITEVTEDVPTDIVLVLDQSASMEENMHTYDFRAYSNRNNRYLYDRRHNGNGSKNLYYPIGDGGYAEVSVVSTQGESSYKYTECPSSWPNGAWSGSNNYYSNQYNLYIKVGEEDYQQVNLKRTGSFIKGYKYTYTFPNGIFVSNGQDTSPGDFDGRGPLYVRSTTQGDYTYTYSYTDKDGVPQTIGTSFGQNTVPTEFTLYERYTASTQTRLSALETAVTNFANSVSQKAAGEDGELGTGDDVNHRIAVVGYASRADSNNPWVNTELFIGATQHNYNVNAKRYYGYAFQDMSTKAGQDNIKASIGALAANGATYTNYGLEMANGILDAYPVEENQKRNRVIILFTDGYPGRNADDFNQTAADSALKEATKAKNAGVSLYSVGIFDGADATTAGDKNGTNTQAANWFMQQVSSNNGIPRNPSYYLSASDADTLNNIFKQIANQIESGGSYTTLDENAVIKDIISPQFTLPTGATANDITLETYHYTGENQWERNADALGASAEVIGDQVSVTGFDFAEHYVGTETAADGAVTYRGDKLVISFTVSPKDGFLGGNNVFTNTSAGVYEDPSATEPVFTFNRPIVNVPISSVDVSAVDKNVYLLSDLTASEIRSGFTVKVGNVPLDIDPTATNFGLESWQNAYVDISVTITDKDGKPVTIADLNHLTDDQTYTVSVTVAPKDGSRTNQGTAATTQSDNGTLNICVFKPVLTYQDGTVDYASTITTTGYVSNKADKTYENDNFVSTSLEWKHGTATADTKMGDAPTLNKTYQYDATATKVDSNGKVISTDFVGVDVTVKIDNTDVTGNVTFNHADCDFEDCTWDNDHGDFEFLLHVINKVADLTITKTGIDDIDHNNFEKQSCIFRVTLTDGTTLDVVITGNGSKTIKDLPIGTYTVTELTNWSWRYSPDEASQTITLQSNGTNSITFNNSRPNELWLNGGAAAHNVFGAVN